MENSFSVVHWVIVLGFIALIAIPTVKILRKAGFSGWWAILAVVPLINWIALWIFAFAKWPNQRETTDA